MPRKELTIIGQYQRDTTRIPQRIFRGRLAEKYDGIGQYVLVSLAGSSTSSAIKARVAAGDFGGIRTFPRGTPVTLTSKHGHLEVFLGNRSLSPCRKRYLCCPGLPEDLGCDAFNDAEPRTSNGYRPFSIETGQTLDKVNNATCGPPAWSPDTQTPTTLDLGMTFTKTRPVNATADSTAAGLSPNNVIDGNDGTYWESSTVGTDIYVDLGTPRAITQFRLLQGPNRWHIGSSDCYVPEFIIQASIDGGANYFTVHYTPDGPQEVLSSLNSGTVTARHWRIHPLDGVATQGTPWRVYAWELKDLGGKNWALVENSPATVYDPRRINWLYAYDYGSDVYYYNPTWPISIYVNGEQKVSNLPIYDSIYLGNYDSKGRQCWGTLQSTNVFRYRWRLPETYVGYDWYLYWTNMYIHDGIPPSHVFQLYFAQMLAYWIDPNKPIPD